LAEKSIFLAHPIHPKIQEWPIFAAIQENLKNISTRTHQNAFAGHL
jgi:hypothetical protein